MQFFQAKDLDKKIKICFLDEETGLNNTVGLFYLMENLHKQYERYEENWSFIIFKAEADKNVSSSSNNLTQKDINIAISNVLKNICRNSDILSFCGENQFCVLTRAFEGDDIVQFTNKILKNFKGIEYKNYTIDINAKFGITFSKHEDTIESFILRAQNALSKAEETKEDIVLNV